jgi:hypothetical protein
MTSKNYSGYSNNVVIMREFAGGINFRSEDIPFLRCEVVFSNCTYEVNYLVLVHGSVTATLLLEDLAVWYILSLTVLESSSTKDTFLLHGHP